MRRNAGARGTIMMLRILAVVSACVCFAASAEAVPVFRPQTSALLQTVQDGGQKRDVWRSPSSLDQFPRLGAADCARYGRENGYPECDGVPVAAKPAEAAAPPAPPLPPESEITESPAPLTAPLPVRRAGLPKQKTPSAWRSGTTRLETPEGPDDGLGKTLGALLIATFDGSDPIQDGPRWAAAALRDGRIGGVLLRGANIESPVQLIALTSFLTEGQRLPPLILIERPGGASDALTGKAGFQAVASAREIGAQGDALEAFNVYQQLADSLSAAGIGMNLGPSATACPDDGAAPDCFGSEPRHSAAFATAFSLAHQSRGVLTGLRYVPRSGGLAALYEIMKRKGPDALIVGDDLEMAKTLRLARYSGAIILDRAAENGRPRVGPILAEALRRSADMVLLRSSADLSGADLAAVRSAIDSGALSKARIEDAARRTAILRMQLKTTRSQVASQIGASQ
jgi:hypothetical protein